MVRRRSIFFRMFFGFWLVTLLSSGSVYLCSLLEKSLRNTEYAKQVAQERRNAMLQSLMINGAAAEEIYTREGSEAVAHYSLLVSRQSGIRTHYFFSLDAPLPTGHTPPEVRRLARQVQESGQPQHMSYRDIFLMATPVSSGVTGNFVIAGETRLDATGLEAPALSKGKPATPPASATDTILEQIATLMGRSGGNPLLFYMTLAIGGGLGCYLLSRHITAPLVRLRQTANQMASGDLSVRLGDSFVKRGDEIGELGRDFDRMATRIEELVTLHHRLLRDIAHELRSPLARLNVALELANMENATGQTCSLARIQRESRRLSTLIEQLLLRARLDNATGDIAMERIPLDALLADIIADTNYEMQGEHKTIQARIDGSACVDGNAELLRQALENVIRNAACYTPMGSTVEVTMFVTTDHAGSHACIHVRDHGQGVPEESLPHIFRAFYRVSPARESRTGGVGIGLAIVESTIKAHGGTVCAMNAQDGGLQVELSLPCMTGC